ncbi:uncharacterized protein DUF3515 [Luteimicrobium subarcticum]|uniref:Uncharacterized protein DUF3515 n=1 Tax=Luteimicrobium subarcticum TaxID=620910 RepID=A0A2M8WQX9_9MICO|nr:uncharacterized protein DUF3515 [Luteimicrobium subarcticum]
MGAAGLTAACAPTISVDVAPDATDPVCASVVLDTPDELLTFDRQATSSQATTAWGRSGAAITLRCGVEPPGPSAQCVGVENPDGSSVDWVATQGDAGWTFVTYGRDPAVEVQVPNGLDVGQPTAPLVDLSAAVQDTPATAGCS